MAKIRQIKLLDLLPPSISADTQVKAAAEALDAELQAVTAAISESMIIPQIDTMPEDVIDLLAWQFHLDFYEPENMPVEKKRLLIKQAIAWHKRKGTPAVVQEIVSAIFSDGKTYEWFEYDGDPYKFRVECTDINQEAGTFQRLIDLVNTVKNTRSHLQAIRVNRTNTATTAYGFVQCSGKTTQIGHQEYELETVTENRIIGHAYRVASYITITPKEAI